MKATYSTLFEASLEFYVAAVQVFWKNSWKRRNCFVTSNFSFTHSVFQPFGQLLAMFIKFQIFVCKHFYFFEESKNCRFGKG